MSDQFVGEIRMFGFNFAPLGWAFCNGQILPIVQNTALFSLLGANFGGNGQSTFALPNLQNVAPLNAGSGPGLSAHHLGDTGGTPQVTLIMNEMPSHGHGSYASFSTTGTTPTPAGNLWAATANRGAGVSTYSATGGTNPVMAAAASGSAGSSQPHNNLPPYLTVNFCIALIGIFPERQ
jgi:microcystin-dependent protein